MARRPILSNLLLPKLPQSKDNVYNEFLYNQDQIDYILKNNVYLNLPNKVITIVYKEFLKMKATNPQRKRNLLTQQNIDLTKVKTANLNNFDQLSIAEMYLFGAIHGLVYSDTVIDLEKSIRLAICFRDDKFVEQYTQITKLSRDKLEFLANQIIYKVKPEHVAKNVLKFATLDDLKIIVSERQYNLFDKFEERLARFKRINRHENSKYIKDLYRVSRIEDVIKKDAHVLENLFLDFNTYQIEEIIKACEMKILVDTNLKINVLERLTQYFNVFDQDVKEINIAPFCNYDQRRTLFNYFTDLQIIEYTGCYVPFIDRPELIRKLSYAFTEDSFLILTNLNSAQNTQTTYLTDIKDVINPIGYGKVKSYQVYELDELFGSFTRDEEITFYKPDSGVFTVKEVEDLAKIITILDSKHELITIIKNGLLTSKDRLDYDRIARQQLEWVPDLVIARSCLKEIFNIGMYMRRWLGPGHPYPLLSIHTKIEYDPEQVVYDLIQEMIKLFARMDILTREFILNLKTCEFNQDGVLTQLSQNFGFVLDRVNTSNMCFRIASSIFVGTGYHYLRVLFREVIDGIEGKKIDKIG